MTRLLYRVPRSDYQQSHTLMIFRVNFLSCAARLRSLQARRGARRGSGPTPRRLLLLDCRLLQAMSLADRLQLEKLLCASTACDDVLLSVLAVARGPLFKADTSEGKAAAAQPFLLSPSSRCPIGLCREEMQEDQKYAQPARPAPCQSGRPFPAASILKTCFPCRQATWGR